MASKEFDWMGYNLQLRDKILRHENGENKYLLADFSDSSQRMDIERKTKLVNDFCRVKINVKAFSDEERAKKNLAPMDYHDNAAVFKALGDEFDMPYWALNSIHKPLKDLANTFIYQLKACNLNCLWCYVDDHNKKPSDSNSFFSVREIMDIFQEEKKKGPLYNFRPSGGEQTIVVEQWLEVMREIEKRGLEAYVQGDTNLTNGKYIQYLEQIGETENNILEKIGHYDNFGLLCSFKGTDTESFLNACGLIKKENGKNVPNERFAFLEKERWNTFRDLIGAGIDAYPFIYDPNPKTLESFMDKGAKMFGDGFYLKTWILPLKTYSPTKERLPKYGINQEDLQKRLDDSFKESKEIMQDIVWKKFHLNYQAVPRTGIKLGRK